MKNLILVFAVLLPGCATLSATVGQAVGILRTAEDNNIKVWTLNACSTPFSALIRHPEIVPAIKELCLPQGDKGNPAGLLDEVKK